MRRDLPGLLAAGFLLPIAAIVIWLAGRPVATDDLWWHLALGAVYAQEGPWPVPEPMFHTVGDQPTLPQEWLFQVAVHGWHALFGFAGLRALHAAAAAATLAAAFALFRRAAASLASAALATALFACLAWYRTCGGWRAAKGTCGACAPTTRSAGCPSIRRRASTRRR